MRKSLRSMRVGAFLLAAAVVPVASCGRHGDSPSAHPDIVIVTLDTTRADRLGADGCRAARTPVFDWLAARGVLFRRAWTVAPLTGPAHSSMMTGLYPPAHGFRTNDSYRLGEQATTLAEVLGRAGYRTAAFVAGYPVSRGFGLAQGFETFDDDFGLDALGRPRNDRHADEVNARALPWLRRQLAEPRRPPLFLWIHYYDAHEPREPPPYFTHFIPGREYDAALAYMDSRLGEIVQLLRTAGDLDRSVVVVVGDHGESLGEHGEPTHGMLLYDATLDVPMLVRAPGRFPEGRIREDLASVVDIFPTVLSLARVAMPVRVHGQDLGRPLDPDARASEDVFGREGRDRVAYAEAVQPRDAFGWAPNFAIRRADEKWIAAPRAERFDLASDPAELDNLAGRNGAADRALESLLVQALDEASEPGQAIAPQPILDPATLDRLRALGYVGAGTPAPRPIPPASRSDADAGEAVPPSRSRPWSGGRDAKDEMPAYGRLQAAVALLQDGPGGASRAVAITEELAAHDPTNQEYALTLGRALEANGSLARAEYTYRRIIEQHPVSPLPYLRLGNLLEARGKADESRGTWLELARQDPDAVGLAFHLARADVLSGRADEGLAVAEADLARFPEDIDVLLESALALEALARPGDALARYRRVLALRPAETRALDAAVRLLQSEGRTDDARALVSDCLARSGGNPEIEDRRRRLERGD